MVFLGIVSRTADKNVLLLRAECSAEQAPVLDTDFLCPAVCPCKWPAIACIEAMLVQAPMLDLLHRHIDGKGKQAKLKSPNELQVSLSVSTPPLFTAVFPRRTAFLQARRYCVHM